MLDEVLDEDAARAPGRGGGVGPVDADEHMFDVLDVLEVRTRQAGPSPAWRAVRQLLAWLRERCDRAPL